MGYPVTDPLLRAPEGAGARCVGRVRSAGWLVALLVWLGWLLVGGSTESRAATGPTEYQIKAVFLLNLVKHAGWPADALPPGEAPIRVGIVGEDPFGGALEDAFRGVRVSGRPLEVRRWAAGGPPAGEIHLLFVARSALGAWADLRAGLAGRPVLTVADGDDFCERGGMVNLRVSERGTIRLEVSLGALRASGLALSSRLLSLPSVRHVGGGP